MVIEMAGRRLPDVETPTDRRAKFAAPLLAWYRRTGRSLPWRLDSKPYPIWISEIMLQQTRVETVLGYYSRWMERFPTLTSLAEADLEEVLRVWEGLGYYSRARNLHQAARLVESRWGGALPADAKSLRSLPGIGQYTAGAIASIAFGRDEPAVDGNAARVLARYFEVEEEIDTPGGRKRVWDLARRALPSGKASEFNQALMDLGARICTSRRPDCPNCPIRAGCKAARHARQTELPHRRPRRQRPEITVTAAVIERSGRLLIARRPLKGLLGGLWEFPGGKLEPGEGLKNCLKRELREEIGVSIQVGEELGKYRHAYTHYKVILHAFRCSLAVSARPRSIGVADWRWVKASDLSRFPMGKIDRQIASSLQRIQVHNGRPRTRIT